MGGPVGLQQPAQILVGRVGIANVETNRLPHANLRAQGDRSGSRVRSDHVGNQEVSPLESILIFVHRQTQMQPHSHELGITVGQRVEQLAQPLHRRHSAQGVDHVALRPRNNVMRADRSAALRNDRANERTAANDQTDRSVTNIVRVVKEPVFTRAVAAARHASQHGNAARLGIAVVQHGIRGRAEGVRQQKDGPQIGFFVAKRRQAARHDAVDGPLKIDDERLDVRPRQ